VVTVVVTVVVARICRDRDHLVVNVVAGPGLHHHRRDWGRHSH